MRWMLGKNAVLPALALASAFVIATQAQAATIRVSEVTGAPGATVMVDIILVASAGDSVAGTQNDVTFDGTLISVAAASACVINPAISDRAESCEAEPPTGPCKQLNRSLADVEGGRRFRGLVLSLANTTEITAAGTEITLYTCAFVISESATDGQTFPLANSNCGASDPGGVALETACASGAVNVSAATPTPIPPTLTNTPVPPPVTNTPRPNTPTNTRVSGGGDDDDGCQVVAAPSSHLSWLLLAPAALLVLRRRRR